ncbi:Integrator 10 [Carabus blaptoides fortunei]
MEIDIYNGLSDQDYLVLRAKNALKTDPVTAKAWMITAKTLYPTNFAVQFEAYHIEKEAGHVKEAAKCFSELLGKFQQQQDLWKEVERVTASLRAESENCDGEMQFLCEMFKHIPLDVQHQLLLMTADHCDDTMEHCRLLLLLLKKFPQSIVTHGPRLVDTLISAEKHSHASNQPVNSYRKLLVCELIPLLGDIKIDLSVKLLFRLLHKSIEFYLCSCMTSTSGAIQETDSKVSEPWVKLFDILDLTGKHLKWDPYLTNVGPIWNRETYWQKILSFCQQHKSSSGDEQIFTKQLLYCLTILFLNCLLEYTASLCPETAPGQARVNLILVEAFVDASVPVPVAEPKSKRRKSDGDSNQPVLTADKPGSNQIIMNFLLACNCWDLLHSTDGLKREFHKLTAHLKLEFLLTDFKIDYCMHKGAYEDALGPLQPMPEQAQVLVRNVKLMCIYFCKKNYTACFEHLLLVMSSLPATNIGQMSSNLTVAGGVRHLHYLPLTQTTLLQYCVRLLTSIIKENLNKQPANINELALGVLLTLAQLDWPQQEDLLPPIMDQIRQRGSFQYGMFQNYVINIDILEELMYLRTEHGGRVVLDIFQTPQSQIGQRRIGTRGADKGVKEDFKQAMKRQVARSNEPIETLIVQFITQERIHILQTLMP